MRKLKTWTVMLTLASALMSGCSQAGNLSVTPQRALPNRAPAAQPAVGTQPSVALPYTGPIQDLPENEPLPFGAEADEASFRAAPPSAVPQQLVVAVRPGTRTVLAAESGIRAVREFTMDYRYQVVQIPAGMSREEAIARLSKQAGVVAIQPNRVYSVTMTPNDAMFDQQWALAKNFANAPAAWEKGVSARNVKVAVLDTGVDYNHPELRGRVIKGPDLVDGDGDPMDVHGHGTHVAGIIGAAGNNAEGISGVAYDCQIMAVKVLGDRGNGTTDAVLEGIKWAVDHGARVINMSLGTSDPSIDPVLHMGLEYAYKKGVIVIAAAGNEGGQVGSPANDPYAVAVSSTSHFWRFEWLSFFSNRGDKVEVAAPGGAIWSLLPTGPSMLGSKQGRSSYGKLSGTSMAAPYVAGEAALIVAQHPNWTVEQIRNRIRSAVDDKGSAGRDARYGFGRINLAKALD